jgi:hypothetical protein
MYSHCYAMTAKYGEQTATTSKQQLCKHIPAATNIHVTIEEHVFCVVHAKKL